jgi:hypothetical protein
MNHLNSLEYRKAFNDYLCRGTPIRLSLKAEDVGVTGKRYKHAILQCDTTLFPH